MIGIVARRREIILVNEALVWLVCIEYSTSKRPYIMSK